MESSLCLGCRFGFVKIEILVPEKCDIEKFAAETQNFASEIVAMTKEKPMHYSLTFGSEMDHSKLDFKVHCSRMLNIKQNECSKFNGVTNRDCKVKHLVYNKESTSEQIEINVRQIS